MNDVFTPIYDDSAALAENMKRQKIWEMLQAVLPEYLALFSGNDDKGVPNINFRIAVAWAIETTEHAYNQIFNTEKNDEQETVRSENEVSSSKESQAAQATASGETSQVAS